MYSSPYRKQMEEIVSPLGLEIAIQTQVENEGLMIF